MSNIDYSSADSGATVDIKINISAADNTTAGTIYYVVNTTFPAVQGGPDARAVREGKDLQHKDYYKAGNVTTAGLTAVAINIGGLKGAEQYDIFITAEDIQGNLLKKVTKLHITADTTPPAISAISAVSSTEKTLTVSVTQTAINVGGKLYMWLQLIRQ